MQDITHEHQDGPFSNLYSSGSQPWLYMQIIQEGFKGYSCLGLVQKFLI